MIPGVKLNLPVIDLDQYLKDPSSEGSISECKKAAEALCKYSALAIRDPRVSMESNGIFLDMIEDYFAQSDELKMVDCRPELSYQVGPTPSNTERPRCGRDELCNERVAKMAEKDKPCAYMDADPKWRFFWRIGECPKETKFAQLNANPVIPAAFANRWEKDMNGWGYLIHDAVELLAEMLAVGFGLPKDTFTKLGKNGPHLLAPTASNIDIYNKVGTVLAGFHTDLNFLTIHGKSRYPGLHIWTREGIKMLASVPDGCLLVQAGTQMEHITGGEVLAGFHEVVIVEQTIEASKRQIEKERPNWRISSTLFYHIASDNEMKPIGRFLNEESLRKYPPLLAGTHVQRELGFIELAKDA